MKLIEKKENKKKHRTRRKIHNRKSLMKWQHQNLVHIKRMDHKCYIPDLVPIWLIH